jgi:hypothetical protein
VLVLAVELSRRLGAGLVAGLVVGFGLVGGLLALLPAGLTDPGSTSSLSPIVSWRSNRNYTSVIALGFVLVGGFGLVLVVGLSRGLGSGLVAGLVSGLVSGCVAVVNGQVWPASLAAAQLARRWHTPVHLLRFLDDAHARNVLRTVGPVYQFRHARLQDRLAAATEELTPKRFSKRHRQAATPMNETGPTATHSDT